MFQHLEIMQNVIICTIYGYGGPGTSNMITTYEWKCEYGCIKNYQTCMINNKGICCYQSSYTYTTRNQKYNGHFIHYLVV